MLLKGKKVCLQIQFLIIVTFSMFFLLVLSACFFELSNIVFCIYKNRRIRWFFSEHFISVYFFNFLSFYFCMTKKQLFNLQIQFFQPFFNGLSIYFSAESYNVVWTIAFSCICDCVSYDPLEFLPKVIFDSHCLVRRLVTIESFSKQFITWRSFVMMVWRPTAGRGPTYIFGKSARRKFALWTVDLVNIFNFFENMVL